jgi:VWFA-related protein
MILGSTLRPRTQPTALHCLLVLSALVVAALVRPAAAAPPAAGAPAAHDAHAAAADAADETFYESVDVDVVNVEVVAADRRGRPVAGLAKGDFELYEDGKPVAITNFFSSSEETAAPSQAAPVATAPVAGAAAARPAAPPKPPEQVLNFAIFVDNENLTPTARRPVLAALDQFFRKHVGTGDHVILANYDGGIKVSQPTASDPAALTAAVAKMMTAPAHGGAAVADRRRMQRQSAEIEEATFSKSVGISSSANAEIARQAQEDAEVEGSLDVQRGRIGLAALADFITSLAGLPGRKALLLVSGPFGVEDGEPLLNRVAEHANANRVTVYVLGAVEGAGASSVDASTSVAENKFDQTDALTKALHPVADRTGGLTASNLLNPETFLETVRADVTTYYSLGFAPAHKRDGKVHKLKVKVASRGDLALRYRETYEDRSGDQRAASETLSSLLLGVGENPLGVELSFEPTKPAAGKSPALLPVVVHVPLAKLVLIPGERFHEGKLTLFVATRDERGRLSALHRLAAPVHVANDKLMGALGQSVAFRVEVAVRPGEQSVAVGVRDEVGHVDSTASVPIGPAKTAEASTGSARLPGR